jgi:hypothetical protein
MARESYRFKSESVARAILTKFVTVYRTMIYGLLPLTLGMVVAVLLSGPTFALNQRIAAILRKFDPDTRLEQVCDIEAMNRIGKETKFSPDRAKSDVIFHPSHEGDLMHAEGAAFRNRGQWYQFSFTCKGTPDQLGVVSFTYEIGHLIPESKWADYGLWR